VKKQTCKATYDNPSKQPAKTTQTTTQHPNTDETNINTQNKTSPTILNTKQGTCEPWANLMETPE
jgi:hypothetical protein